MAYTLKFAARVTSFLRNHIGLSRVGRVRLFTNIDWDLRHRGDFYINDPDRRLGSAPLRFWYQIVLGDPSGQQPFHQFWFIVNASGAAYGVLEVEYADEGGPPSS